jgi:hypothetical protein
MNIQETTVKEFHFALDAFPRHTFKVQAETREKALRQLIADLRAGISELQQHKGQKQNQTQPA